MEYCLNRGASGQACEITAHCTISTGPEPTPAPPAPTTPAPQPTSQPPQPTPTQQPTSAPTTPAPTTAAPTPAPPTPAQCCTGQGSGCIAPCSSGGWCGASESNCNACAGNWCGGSSPTPPAPTPAVNPTPAPPAPTPPAPGPSVCCYDGGCTGNCVAGGWCGGSEANCVGCGGEWCSSASALVSNSTMQRLRVHSA